MVIGRFEARANPWGPLCRVEAATLFRTRAAHAIWASGRIRPQGQAGHMTASAPTTGDQNPCKQGPSTYGPPIKSGVTGVGVWMPRLVVGRLHDAAPACGGDRGRVRRAGGGRAAGGAGLPGHRAGAAGGAGRAGSRASAGRVHLRCRAHHHHRALPARGAVGAGRSPACATRWSCGRSTRSTGSASTTGRPSPTRATPTAMRAEVARLRARRRAGLRALHGAERGDLPDRLRAAWPCAVRLVAGHGADRAGPAPPPGLPQRARPGRHLPARPAAARPCSASIRC